MKLKWFARFKADNFDLDHQEHPGRTLNEDEDRIESLIENNSRYTTRELAEMLETLKTTTHEHSKKFGYVNHFNVRVPHN